jgi:hypothetical protein
VLLVMAGSRTFGGQSQYLALAGRDGGGFRYIQLTVCVGCWTVVLR